MRRTEGSTGDRFDVTVIPSLLICPETSSVVIGPTSSDAETPPPPPLRWVLLLGPSYCCFLGASRIPQRVPRNSGARHHSFLLIYSLPNSVMFPAPLSLSEESNWLFLLRYRCRESQSHPLLGPWFKQLCMPLFHQLEPVCFGFVLNYFQAREAKGVLCAK